MPVLFDLFAEILPQIEQGYKAQVARLLPAAGNPPDGPAARRRLRQPIRVILPIPSTLLEDCHESLITVYQRLRGISWITAAGPFPDTAIKDAGGSTVFDLSGGDFVAIDVTCKPFRDVHLA